METVNNRKNFPKKILGTRHLKALNEMMLWQKVDYDFEYHPVTFHVDVPTFVISAGKSLFTVEISKKFPFLTF
jgi:predicted nuclease of restriction endonuclease-like RecB superfamily